MAQGCISRWLRFVHICLIRNSLNNGEIFGVIYVSTIDFKLLMRWVSFDSAD